MKSKNLLFSVLILSGLSLYGCPSNTVVNPPGAQGTTSTSIDLDASVKTKADLVNAYKCAIASSSNESEKAQLQAGLNVITALPESSLNAINMSAHITTLKNYVNSSCNLSTGTIETSGSTTNPTPTSSVTPVSNGKYTVYGCDAEKTLKSGQGKSINVKFINNTGSTVKIYWITATGTKVPYNNNLTNGATHNQQTFVTHPWVITDSNDKCLGVFLFNDSTDLTLNSSVFASVNTGVSVGTDTNGSTGNTTGNNSVGFDVNTSIKTKADLINAYNCAIALESNSGAKTILTNGLAQIKLLPESSLGLLMSTYITAISKYDFSGCSLSTGTISGSGSTSVNTGNGSASGTVTTTVTAGNTNLLPIGSNLARLPGVILNVSSEYNTIWDKSRLIDGNIDTSWFTKAGDAANLGTIPYVEVVFPSPVSIKGVNLKGNREYSDGYDILEGRLIVNSSTSGTSTYNVTFPAPDRDFNVMFNQAINNVTSVKFESTKDESGDPGLAEFEVVAG